MTDRFASARKAYGTPDCRCFECNEIHSEFIMQFGRWPSKTHEQGQELKARRLDNEASWDRIINSGGTK